MRYLTLSLLSTFALLALATLILRGAEEPRPAAPAAASKGWPAPSDASLAASAAAHEEYPQPAAGSLRSYLELARRDIQLQKATIIAANVSFTDDEAAEFWPIYREYEAELYQINNRKLDLIRGFLGSDARMSDEEARSLAAKAFDIEDARTALKRKYFAKFQEAIPASKAARFFQIENQLNMVVDLRLAAALPLIK
jgi:hypothetical protein